jgi:hypothetical protein
MAPRSAVRPGPKERAQYAEHRVHSSTLSGVARCGQADLLIAGLNKPDPDDPAAVPPLNDAIGPRAIVPVTFARAGTDML